MRLVHSLCKQSSDTEVCVTISQHLLDILMGKGKTNSIINTCTLIHVMYSTRTLIHVIYSSCTLQHVIYSTLYRYSTYIMLYFITGPSGKLSIVEHRQAVLAGQ